MYVRWDAVVDRATAAAGSSCSGTACSASAGDTIQAGVQLFGALSSMSPERRIKLVLPSGATVSDMLAVLGERLGKPLIAHVLDRMGRKHRHCRLYVDVYPIEDVHARLAARAQPTQVEIILLIAPEGG
jgi:hypothetical protein